MFPLWLKLAYTAMAAGILVAYWFRYGPANYLWLSDVALILLVPALWLESALLTSVVAVGTLALELFWVVDLLARLLFGHRSDGLTGYVRCRPSQEVLKDGIVTRLSPETVRLLLKKTNSNLGR